MAAANVGILSLKSQSVTIASGSITVSSGGFIEVSAESGTTDTLDTILFDSGLAAEIPATYYPWIYIKAASGHTITLTDDHLTLSANQMSLTNGANMNIDQNNGVFMFRYGGTWLGVGAFPQLDGGVIDANTAQTLANKTLTSLALDGIPSGYAGSQQVFDQNGIATTDATVTDIINIPISTNQSLMIEALVHGKKDDESAGIVAKVVAGAKRAGANISLIGTPSITVVEDAGTQDVTVDVDTGTQALRVRCTGILAESWVWVANYNYSIVTTTA